MSKTLLKSKLVEHGYSNKFLKNYFAPCPSFNNSHKIHEVFKVGDRIFFIESRICTHSDDTKTRYYTVRELYTNSKLVFSPNEFNRIDTLYKDLDQLQSILKGMFPQKVRLK